MLYGCACTATLRLTALMAAESMPLQERDVFLLGVFLLGGALSDERYSEAFTARRVPVDSGALETLRLLVPADAFLKSRSRLRICA